MRILIVEDETRIASLIQMALGKAGFTADTAANAEDGRAAWAAISYDLIILDLGLPGVDGLGALSWLRSANNPVPVLVLTARDTIEDRVDGLNAGADDYLVKPFAMSELLARIKALLRRPGHALGISLEIGNIIFDTIGREASVAGKPLALSRRELAVLEHLMRRSGRVVPKDVLEEKLYGIDEELESNAIPVHVSHLRKKLIAAAATPQIHTVRGVGYLLVEPS